MLNNKKIVVVMPAYNAAHTLQSTYDEIPLDVVDEVILVDDCSSDDTIELARSIGLTHIIRHDTNTGYGGNQKTCYKKAIELGGDVIIMLHPDYQYTPKLITSMASLITEGVFDCVLGSRILGTGALNGGMPVYKFISNRLLTAFQNLVINYKLSEYHTGYRAFSREILQTLPLDENANGFVFDNQMLAQIIYAKFSIGEITCPTRYAAGSSSISFTNSVKYGIGVMKTSILFFLNRHNLITSPIFKNLGSRNKPVNGK